MKIGIIATNSIPINRDVKKGTEIFLNIFINELARMTKKKYKHVHPVLFASGDSESPIPKISVTPLSSVEDPEIMKGNHKLFELALFSKAFSLQKEFDLFHVHVSNGEYLTPFAPFVRKPILITMHGGVKDAYDQKYFQLFKGCKNIHFISISDNQRNQLPDVPYVGTVYNGIDTRYNFKFSPEGGTDMLWVGRGMPEKGLDTVLDIINKTKRSTKIFPILNLEHLEWLKEEFIKQRNKIHRDINVTMNFDINRTKLVKHYQTSKLFLFPIQWEEPFGLVMVEAMACGTPVVAYAKGSVPEIVKDGETGFIVNPSPTDIRGEWITKKTGVDGLCEAVEKIYSMPQDQYETMRRKCRDHTRTKFSSRRMVTDYVKLYRHILSRKT
ncbi:hypothetical protein COT62_03135 [Candidatus Roizmanbacteria bacterium CG09_land_8_20_14_0_10_41_9]|uniref:Glycosyl transferase family 1 domain-containing protein n=1 Tax=Candidatus Roizmanbacteria bacterium CG09_land_8_20_14_0_10_41_9 TaxID=1974850 RepID=A0A2H0WSD7_9BACT|nr:MAG: hypothetical protein COT62_03135 [Candidatus Roizmanbacteria bacterium CG09_land_8_20_14_0_10_41_9]